MIGDIHESWRPFFALMNKDALEKVLSNGTSPTRDKVFNVFKMPLYNIKVVLLGQDPYPNIKQATGYAFENGLENKIPASLRIMNKEAGGEIDFSLLRKQGVFLLNTALTTQAGEIGSHVDFWKKFTEKLIEYISKNTQAIYILLGKKAQYFRKFIYNKFDDNLQILDFYGKNIVLEAPHPAAEVYSGGKAGFLGSDIFKRTSDIYQQLYGEPLKWIKDGKR